MRRFYRHSVWIDIFGVLLFGAGYLLYHAGGAASSFGGGNAVASGGGGARSPQPRLSRPAPPSSTRPRPNPLFGSGGAAPAGGVGV